MSDARIERAQRAAMRRFLDLDSEGRRKLLWKHNPGAYGWRYFLVCCLDLYPDYRRPVEVPSAVDDDLVMEWAKEAGVECATLFLKVANLRSLDDAPIMVSVLAFKRETDLIAFKLRWL